MYAIPKGRDAVAPGLGGDPAAAPRLDWRLPRSEQPADQLGSLSVGLARGEPADLGDCHAVLLPRP